MIAGNEQPADRARGHAVDLVILALSVVAIYGRILGHDFQRSWDDNWYVLYNEAIRGLTWANLRTMFTSVNQANFAPLQILSYAVDYALWGFNPAGYFLTNILFHALNGMLLYRLLLSLHGDRTQSLVASLFYLVHPLQVENVAWISERKSLLAIFFFLIAWDAYRRYREAAPGKGRTAYIVSVAAFAASLLSKSTTLVLPAVLVLYDQCFPIGKDRRLRLKDKIPYAIAAGVFVLITLRLQLPEEQGGIRVPYHGGGPWATLLTMLPVLCRYLGMLIWPANLSAEYMPPVHRSLDGAVLAAALLLSVVAWLGYRLFKADRKLGFWFLFFWVGLLPYLQIVPIMSLMNDRYLNLSIIGAAALFGAGVVHVIARASGKRANLLYVVLALWLTGLSVLSFQRAGVWRDSFTLWSDAVEKTPNSSRAWEIHGETLWLRGETDAARQAYERGLALDPSNTEILNGLGSLYVETGDLDKGYGLLTRLLKIKPQYVMGWANLGDYYVKRGDYARAEQMYLRAHELQPEALQVVSLLGDLAFIRKRFDEAWGYYEEIESEGEGDARTAYRLAVLATKAGRNDEAGGWLLRALQRGYDDRDALCNGREMAPLRADPRARALFAGCGGEGGR